MGPMRLKSNHLAFGNIMNTQDTEKSLEVVNTSGEALTIEFVGVPGHISISAVTCQTSARSDGIADGHL